MEDFVMRNQIKVKSKLFILMAILLLAWVGVSCKNNKPGEEGGMELRKPDDVVNKVGDDQGVMNSGQMDEWNDKFIQIRLMAVSEDGGYYRNPVIATFGQGKRTKVITVMEKRFGLSGERDVAVNGETQVELLYQLSDNSGYTFGRETTIGASAQGNPENSRGAPVVFVDESDAGSDEVIVVAAAGSGMYGDNKPQGSQIKIIKGTPSGNTMNWGEGWKDLDISHNGETGSKAIMAYMKEKMGNTPQGTPYNSVYLRSGQGRRNGTTLVLPLCAISYNPSSGSDGYGYFGVLVIYSTDGGSKWQFGPYKHSSQGRDYTWGQPSSQYREAKGILLEGTTITVLAPRNSLHDQRPRGMGLWSGDYTTTDELSGPTDTGITEAVGGVELAKNTKYTGANVGADTYYLINTANRAELYNKDLTLYITTKDMNDGVRLNMTDVSGVGSVAVLEDGSLVTLAEEAYAEGSRQRETKFNLVQRRFTPGYIRARAEKDGNRIPDEDRFYNPTIQ